MTSNQNHRQFLKIWAKSRSHWFITLALCLMLTLQITPTSAQEVTPAPTQEAAEQKDIISVITPEKPLGSYQEAPSLAELVAAGKLPPVQERLPDNPPVVVPFEQVGQYGGTLRLVNSTYTNFSQITRYMQESLFSRSAPNATYSYANLAESLDVSNDLQTFTIHLRKGVKWSDGVPLTSADFMFNWNDVVLYSPDPSVSAESLIPGDMIVGGKPITLEAPDDYTLVIKTAVPFAEFYARMLAYYATPARFGPSPAHYLKQFHPKYATFADPVKAWNDFKSVYNQLTNPDRPSIGPWVVAEYSEWDRIVLRRNPYYWKVDEEGKQLPYVDEITGVYVGDSQVLTLQLASGSYDLMIGGLPLSPVLFQEQERGNYRLIPNTLVRFVALKVNLTWMSLQDHTPEYGRLVDLFKNPQFLQALELGLDKQRFTAAWAGAGLEDYIGTTWGSMILHRFSDILGHSDPRVDQLVANRQDWMRYDVTAANKILDDLGLTIGSDGYRQYPDGGRIEIAVGSYTDYQPVGEITDVAAAALEENLHIKFNLDDRPYQQGVHDFIDGYGVPLAGADYVGKRFVNDYINVDYLYQRPVTNYVRSNGAQGVKPYDELMKPLQDLWAVADKASVTTDPAQRLELSIQAAQIMEQNYLDYPLTLAGRDDYFLVHNGVMNVPNGFPFWADERNIRLEDWWINQ